MDSPTHIGNNLLREWTVTDKGKTKTIQLALHHNGTNAEADAYTDRIKKVVLEQQAIFGELPDYDFGRYTFLATYLPQADGDGMEHRNSTVLTSNSSLRQNAGNLLGTVSHEFFHAWNVERIRPATLEPFKFMQANMSGELWFAEGFTNYYGGLVLVRTGDESMSDYASRLTFVTNYLINSPGRRYFNALEMSQQAPFVDAAVSIEPHNRTNTFISYYFYGEAIALALDLSLRGQFKNTTLDTYMRRVWEKYGKTEKPYIVDDLRVTLGEVTGNQTFADTFFSQYITGKEAAPYESLLAQAGFQMQKTNSGKASLVPPKITFTDKGGVLESPVLVTSPLYAAGLQQGDIILTVDGQRATQSSLSAALNRRKPGEMLEIEFEQYGAVKAASLKLTEDPQLTVTTFEEAGKPVSKAIRDFRQAWLKVR
jgi:predicted metalloprotease with PDZ domain